MTHSTSGPVIVALLASLAILGAACSNEEGGDSLDGCSGESCAGASGTGASGTGDGPGDGTGGASGGSGGGTGGGATGGGTGGDGTPGWNEPPAKTCTPTASAVDTSGAETVGDGTAASCTEQALRDAALDGGTIVFDCGPDPVTIELTETIHLPEDVDTIIHGDGQVTLDAGGTVRHFRYHDPDWMNGTAKVVLSGLILRNGQAPLENYRDPIDGYPECAYGYGNESGGGAIWVRNVNLEILDCQFYDNQAALEGPDVGGGAIYATGAPSVLVSGSRFENNTAANGGAIAMLFANPVIENSTFENNTAVGFGQNRRVSEQECPAEYAFGHENQAGHGGLAGGVYFDGLNDEDHTMLLCGVTFRENRANELAGALFRTPNSAERELTIDRCTFDANTARLGGATFIKDNFVTVRASTFARNRGRLLVDGSEASGALGGLWVNSGDVDVENSTFFDNTPSGLNLEGAVGEIRASTFVESNLGGDFAIDGSLLVDSSCGGSTSGSDNLEWPSGDACVSGSLEADPQLGELGDNGGPTETAAPPQTSPAVGTVATCPGTDQRGEPRPSSDCTAGAVEP